MYDDVIAINSNDGIFRSHNQVSERLKELKVKVKPPRPPNPSVTATASTKKGVAKGGSTTCTNTQQHSKQQVDTQAELLYQITEGVSAIT